jgi:hypothetical protein
MSDIALLPADPIPALVDCGLPNDVRDNYPYRMIYVRFVGTHREYDKIDLEEV